MEKKKTIKDFQVLANRMLIKPILEGTTKEAKGLVKTESGLIVSDKDVQQSTESKTMLKSLVCNVGPGISGVPMTVKEGDVIWHYPLQSMIEYKPDLILEKEEYFLLAEGNVILIEKPQENKAILN